MFAAAFPLAPLIALITNVIDLRVDARRMLWFNRRPLAERAEDIGKCFLVMTNSFIHQMRFIFSEMVPL